MEFFFGCFSSSKGFVRWKNHVKMAFQKTLKVANMKHAKKSIFLECILELTTVCCSMSALVADSGHIKVSVKYRSLSGDMTRYDTVTPHPITLAGEFDRTETRILSFVKICLFS